MADVYDPFMTVLRDLDPRGDTLDPRDEIQALATREQLISDLISGDGYADSALDCLAEQGINPHAWIEATVANIEWVMDQGIRFTSNDHGLFLPEHLNHG